MRRRRAELRAAWSLLLARRTASAGRSLLLGRFGADRERSFAPPSAEQGGADEAAIGRGRRNDHLDLVRELVGECLLDQERVPADQIALARHLLGIGLADALHPVDLGVGQL